MWRHLDVVGVPDEGIVGEVLEHQVRIGVVLDGEVDDFEVLSIARIDDLERCIEQGRKIHFATDQQVFEPDDRASGKKCCFDGLSAAFLGKHQVDGAVSAGFGPIGPVDQIVDVRYADEGEIVVQGNLKSRFRIGVAVDHFDPVQVALIDKCAMKIGHSRNSVGIDARVVGMVPEHERALRVCNHDGLLGRPLIGGQEMTDRIARILWRGSHLE